MCKGQPVVSIEKKRIVLRRILHPQQYLFKPTFDAAFKRKMFDDVGEFCLDRQGSEAANE